MDDTDVRTGEARYRERIEFDGVAWGSHCADCFPSGCTYYVFLKDGKVVREEIAGPQAGRPDPVKSFPDDYPRGCNKGAAWSAQLDAPDRLLYPLRRVGERGSGRWERISWDEALDAIADGLLDAMESAGPRSILREGTPEIGSVFAADRFVNLLGGTVTDLNASIGDFAPGFHLTLGKSFLWPDEPSPFEAELLLYWHVNPVYTWITPFHYFSEARYHGTEIAMFAPDVNPSHMHVDHYVPVRMGSDAALALAMCQVIVEEGLVDEEFVRTQTDLSLLVRADTGRFLRAADLDPAARHDQFFHLDEQGRVVEADRGNLLPDGYTPALSGRAEVTLADGTTATVAPLMERLATHLDAYRPEAVYETTSVHPDTVRSLARKVASRRTRILMGMAANKAYHSDLYQRTMLLLLALTGNWGKPGAGFNNWASPQMDGWTLTGGKQRSGPEGAEEVLAALDAFEEAFRGLDDSLSPELASFELIRAATKGANPPMVPPAFFWYWHAGFRELWNRPGYGDPTMARPFDDYWNEAMANGWWSAVAHQDPDHPPRVFIECGGNLVRRTRGGRNTVLEHLWPKLDLVVTIDIRMSSTALWSDIVLPAAQHYEKVGLDIPLYTLVMTDRATEPMGESKPEWEIFRDLTRAVARRAAARGIERFDHPDGTTRRFDELPGRYTLDGALETSEQVVDEVVRDAAYASILPEGSDLATLREHGSLRFTDWGRSFMARCHAAPWPEADEIANPLQYHLERGDPYPTLTRRAQFLIEHPWFVEAGEDLPVHKDMPKMGGDHPFVMSSGHNRWSVHAMNMGNPILLQTHRGEPHVVVNPDDAARLGIADHDRVRVFNDVGSFVVRAKIGAGQQPGGVTVYNGWDPHMFEEWGGPNDTSPGMVKHLNLAAGYGHLNYGPLEWQPVPVDRGVRVGLERLGPA